MSVPIAEDISRGPSFHFASLMAFFTPTSATSRGSSNKDKGLSVWTFLRNEARLKSDLDKEVDERQDGSGQRGGKVTLGEWALFLTLEPGLVSSLPQV